MFDIGLPEFFVLGVIALLVFGPERLPEVALQAARMIRRLRGMADSARTELTADLGPHMRELNELRELDPRKMAKRYVLDPVNEDGTFDELRGKGLLKPSSGGKAAKKKAAAAASPPPVGETAVGGAASAAAAAAGSAALAATAETAGEAPGAAAAAVTSNGSANGAAAGTNLPPAMRPPVTARGEAPPFDLDAT